MSTILSQQHALQLLDKLATDDAFREHLLGDPAGAMATLGIKVDPASVPAVRSLPSKAEVSANSAQLNARLQGVSGMAIFYLA